MPSPPPEPAAPADPDALPVRGSVLEVLAVFLKLGLTSFGGPVAHLGYFHTEFVLRRRWIDERSYADLVALCQFLPGPASSQVGMALGLGRAGWWGALVAWLGFTLPSALALMLLAVGLSHWAGLATGAVHGLKVVAVAVVAQAVWGMARALCPDRLRAGWAIASALLVLVLPSTYGQLAAIFLGAVLGRWGLNLGALPPAQHQRYGVSKTTGTCLLLVYAVLLALTPWAITAHGDSILAVSSQVYQAGALVFGGGHVVLPLLQAGLVPGGLVSNELLLAGYGAAQAAPGPLFSFAAYLGMAMPAPLGGWWAGMALLVAIFLPGFLLVAGALPHWESLRQRAGVQRAMAGINASVVGVLLAALYDPVWTSAIHSRLDVALALAAFGLLVFARLSPLWVVFGAALCGWLWF
ncbi:chromate efflux transporter [Comamonas piscis]